MKRRQGERYPNGRLKARRRYVDWNGDKRHAVYVMTVDSGSAVKVGVSKSPGRRCESIQTTQHGIVRIFWAGRFTAEHWAYMIEKEVHRALTKQGHHINGEWFRCSAAWARGEIVRIASERGIEIAECEMFGWAERRAS